VQNAGFDGRAGVAAAGPAPQPGGILGDHDPDDRRKRSPARRLHEYRHDRRREERRRERDSRPDVSAFNPAAPDPATPRWHHDLPADAISLTLGEGVLYVSAKGSRRCAP